MTGVVQPFCYPVKSLSINNIIVIYKICMHMSNLSITTSDTLMVSQMFGLVYMAVLTIHSY